MAPRVAHFGAPLGEFSSPTTLEIHLSSRRPGRNIRLALWSPSSRCYLTMRGQQAQIQKQRLSLIAHVVDDPASYNSDIHARVFDSLRRDVE